MYLRDNNKISMYTEYYNVDEGDGIHFNQTQMHVYHVLKKQLENDGPVPLDEQTSRYVDIFFAQEEINWSLPHAQRSSVERIPARPCTQSDFGHEPKHIQEFERWNGFSVICPDLKPGQGFFIKGDSDSKITHSY